LAADDRARWGELWQGYLTFYESSVPDDVTETTWQRLLTPGEGHDGFAAVDAYGKVVGITHYLFHGSTWTVGTYCYLEDLFVDPSARGSGAGRALIEAVQAKAEKRGAARLYLNTQNFNETARKLYDKVMTLSPFVQYRTQLK